VDLNQSMPLGCKMDAYTLLNNHRKRYHGACRAADLGDDARRALIFDVCEWLIERNQTELARLGLDTLLADLDMPPSANSFLLAQVLDRLAVVELAAGHHLRAIQLWLRSLDLSYPVEGGDGAWRLWRFEQIAAAAAASGDHSAIAHWRDKLAEERLKIERGVYARAQESTSTRDRKGFDLIEVFFGTHRNRSPGNRSDPY
jgi:hypothetical protein